MQLICNLYVSSTYVTFCVKSYFRLIDLQTSSSYVEVLVVVKFGEEVVVQKLCTKDDIFRQRRLNHIEVGEGIAFRRVYPARAYSTVVVLVSLRKLLLLRNDLYTQKHAKSE